MNRNFIFALILLATLSIVSARPLSVDKGIEFKKCEGYPKDVTIALLDVEVTPDPIKPGTDVEFKISGTVDNFDIPDGTYLNVRFFDPDNNNSDLVTFSMNMCMDTACPIKAGTPYSTTRKLSIPKQLPSKYSIYIDEFLFAPDVTIPYACAIASIGS